MYAIDFLQNKMLRQSIQSRERGSCFYCLRRITAGVQCLDHVVPQVRLSGNSYRNLVSCCLEGNPTKGQLQPQISSTSSTASAA
jgi:hypothetical protein